jgi:DNA-binding IclR family transcriptional regulator
VNLPAEIQLLQLLGTRPEKQRTVSCLARLSDEPIVATRELLERLQSRGTVARRGRVWEIAS